MRYQVRDSNLRKINIIEWDGKASLGKQYADCSITPDDGSPIWMAPPTVVSRRQFMLGLNAQGKLAEVNTAVAHADLVTRLSWDTAMEFHRDDPLVVMMAHAGGWSDSDLDSLFTVAATF